MTEKRQRDEGSSSVSKGVKESRRNFLKATSLAATAAAVGSVASPFVSRAEAQELLPRQVPLMGMATTPGKANHWYVPASDKTVHWGYFSKTLKPLLNE